MILEICFELFHLKLGYRILKSVIRGQSRQSVAYWVNIGPKELVMWGLWAMSRPMLLSSTTDQLILIDFNPDSGQDTSV